MPIQLPLLTFASIFQVAKTVLTSKLLFSMIFCKGSSPSDSNLIMNTSRTSKRSNSPAFPFQHPSHNFLLYLSLLWLLGFACQHSRHQQPTLQCQARPRRASSAFLLAPSSHVLGPGMPGLGDKLTSQITGSGERFSWRWAGLGSWCYRTNRLALRAPAPTPAPSTAQMECCF